VNLRIELRRSPRLITLILAPHLGALAILPMLDLPWLWRGLAAIAVLVSLAREWRKHILRGPGSAVAVQVSDDGAWSLRRAGAAEDEPASLLSLFAHPALVVLRLKTGNGARVPVILMPDTQDGETLRQLRVRLAALQREKK
jgi:hypothetical protein